MLLIDDTYDPDDVLMDIDTVDEFYAISEDETEIDFENPSFVKSTLGEFASETESITGWINYYSDN